MNEFDIKAQVWDLDKRKKDRARVVAQEIRKLLSPGQKYDALEFGCGTGLLSVELKDDFNSIILADTSAGMIEVLESKIASEGLSHFSPLLIDDEGKKLLSLKVDVVYSLMTLHHIHHIDNTLQTLHKIIKPGGLLCIIDLNKEDGSFHHNQEDYDVHWGFEREKIEDMFLNNGFEPLHYCICYVIKRQIGEIIKEYPLFMLTGKKALSSI